MLAAVHPPNPSQAVTTALLGAGLRPVPVADVAAISDQEPGEGWALLLVELEEDPTPGLAIARRVREDGIAPVLVVASRLHTTALAEASMDDFVLSPIDPDELAVRAIRLAGSTPDSGDDTIEFKDLHLNLATYQATVEGDPVDLTFMEYELLRFFMSHPGRVWSREQLLSRVWGYDYFGGARTVDVHVRRLRAKLGEERASWITTVRSVGYRFG